MKNPSPLAIPILVACLGQAAAQSTTEPGSDAETKFQAAFWQETGKGELDEALQGYLAAVDAAGPAAVRARALLHAAGVLHRLDQEERARASLERLFQEFPEERGVIAQGRLRLEEWRKIDLRRNYSDWYRQHLFTKEIQAQVLALLQRLGTISTRSGKSQDQRKAKEELRALEGKILVFGQGAAPALAELAKTGASAGQATITERATRLLFLIGRLPPLEALLADHHWLAEPRAWRTIFRVTPQEKQPLLTGLDRRHDPVSLLLRAAAAGPQRILPLLQNDTGAVLARDHTSGLEALLKTLLEADVPNMPKQLFDLSRSEQTPIRVRQILEMVLAENEVPGVSAADWLAWSRDRMSLDACAASMRHAGRAIRAGDGDVLDGLFSRIEETTGDARNNLFSYLAEGLRESSRPLLVPWTEDRIYRMLLIHPDGNFGLNESLGYRWGTEEGSRMIAAALLRHPSKLSKTLTEDGSGPGSIFRIDGMGPDENVVRARWHHMILDQLKARWEAWSAADRMAALSMIAHTDLFHTDYRFPTAIQEFLVNHAGGMDETAKEALQRIAERVGG